MPIHLLKHYSIRRGTNIVTNSFNNDIPTNVIQKVNVGRVFKNAENETYSMYNDRSNSLLRAKKRVEKLTRSFMPVSINCIQ